MRNLFIIRVKYFVLLLILLPLGRTVYADEPVIHALFFYSPSCPHCHTVITEDLLPFLDKYGDQILILGINTYTEMGNELFSAAVKHFDIPQERLGVPMLIVGETVLVGAYEIPQLFPEIITKGLVSGGIDWPDIPGLAQLLKDETIAESNENNPKEDGIEENIDADKEDNTSSADINQDEFVEERVSQKEQSSIVTSDIGDPIVTTENMTVFERFMQDKTGNSISTLVLFGMIFSVVFAGVLVLRPNHVLNQWPNWFMTILLIIGLAVAIYMAYVEVTRAEAICGPVGDCNTVQQSPYAFLFGLIPIGLLGVLGYLVIGIVWLFSIMGPSRWRKISLFSLWGLLLFGTLFSIYLTFLEPFVIGATCSWCLTSAVVMTLLYWNSTAYITQIGGISHLKFIGQEQ
jgi:uncharacterized membrane protein/thiol-disulfide isomerase/thioredoxin